MSATVNANANPFLKEDRVKINDKSSFLFGQKGTVKYTFDSSVEVKLDEKLTVIVHFSRLKKLKKKSSN